MTSCSYVIKRTLKQPSCLSGKTASHSVHELQTPLQKQTAWLSSAYEQKRKRLRVKKYSRNNFGCEFNNPASNQAGTIVEWATDYVITSFLHRSRMKQRTSLINGIGEQSVLQSHQERCLNVQQYKTEAPWECTVYSCNGYEFNGSTRPPASDKEKPTTAQLRAQMVLVFGWNNSETSKNGITPPNPKRIPTMDEAHQISIESRSWTCIEKRSRWTLLSRLKLAVHPGLRGQAGDVRSANKR